mgnify:CR=1 FL=1
MSMETELIHALDTIAFEKSTTDEEKLESMQNLLYSYEQIQTAKSLEAEKHRQCIASWSGTIGTHND